MGDLSFKKKITLDFFERLRTIEVEVHFLVEIIKQDAVKRFKVNKVSIDELLTVHVSDENDPQRFDNSHYFVVLFSKAKKYDSVRVFGTFFNEDHLKE